MKSLWWLLLPAVSFADVPRYNDAPRKQGRSQLVARIDELVMKQARATHQSVPSPDASLDAAAREIARLSPEHGSPPNELVQGALWAEGIIEPPGQFILVGTNKGGDDELLRRLAPDLPASLSQGHYTRLGVGVVEIGDELRVVIGLQESFVALEPVARQQPLGASVVLRGKLHTGYVKPSGFISAPDGKVVSRLSLSGDDERFNGLFRCGPDKGRYQVEIAGQSRFGSAVVANFPIYCGVPAPATAQAAAPPGADPNERWSPPAEAERAMWQLLNADRKKAGLPALAWDARLSALARAHSTDMLKHRFFGHTSPTTGKTEERARRAGIVYQVLAENVARAFSPGEAERGLMNSPGHRANILSPLVTRAGVGIVADEAARELLVTQVFIRPFDKKPAR